MQSVDAISTYKNKSQLFAHKQLVRCPDCALIFINPLPSEKDLDSYYKNVWLNDESIVSTSSEAAITHQLQADERVKYLSRYLNLSTLSKVLDVGSGDGFLFDSFKKNNLSHISFYATDPSDKNIQKLRRKGINAYYGLDQITERDFDLIAICFVLEHIGDPLQFMKYVLQYVKKNGYIFIDIPERDDLFKPFLEPHVMVYTKQSLLRLLEKLSLTIIHCTGYGIERSRLVQQTTLWGKIVKKIFSLKKFLCRQMYIVLLRKNSHEVELMSQYKEYKLDQEGSDRWWLRTVVLK
ncbi:MAG: methyltransferase domain-containing protein [bacterium]